MPRGFRHVPRPSRFRPIAGGAGQAPVPPEEARAYTRWLATHHYENFHVVSFLLPKRLHQDFYNVYSYCRWADDLGDEIGDTAESLRLLAWWRGELDAMYAGRATHPVFVALIPTVRELRHPAAAVRRPDRRLRAGPDGDPLSQLGRAVRLLPQFGQSGGPAGALSLRLLRCRAAAALRRHLHRAATGQLLAGRDGGPAQGSRLHPARSHGAARLHGGGSVRAPLHARLSRGRCARSWTKARELFPEACRCPAWWTGGWRSISTCSAAAACACWTRSSSRATTCWRRVRRSRKAERVRLLLGSLARVAFSRAA